PYSNCRGSKTRYFSCNIQDCSEGTDFRGEQCAHYNHIEYEGKTYEWIPYRHAENQCALNCMPKGERYYYRHRDAVHDGTPCNEDSLDVCVEGKCLPVGCDKLLGSTAKEDSCRVCGGDGSTCTKKSGVIETNAQHGYVDLFLIPANATNIRIQERRASNNYLAIRNKDNTFYLNGGWTISNSGVLKFAGTKFHYSRKPFPNYAPEVVYALGPTTEPLYVALLYQEHNPGIEYVYSVPVGSVRESTKQGYTWRTDPFSECSVTCGGGKQTRKVWCSHGSEQVGNVLCDSSTEPAESRICGEQACPAKWVLGEWSRCSAPCGEIGYQTREVNCQQAVGFSNRTVTEHLCKGEKPESSRQCQEKGPCPVWHIGPWKPCDHLCGEGRQSRDVVCYKKEDGLVKQLPDSDCLDVKPVTERTCLLMPCEGLDWITSEWSGCSDKCGQAIETRIVKCSDEKGHSYNESLCHSYRKPESVKNCTYVPCSSQWFTSQWNKCSAKCGQGIQSRSVICASLDGNKLSLVDNSKCDEKMKPESTMECRAEQECKGEWFVSPFGECSKPCGGGRQERTVLCLRDNTTVNLDECDKELFILDNSKDCNTQPCGEDELIPVSTAQVITEEESEECDYGDYSEYDESTDSDDLIKLDGVSTVGMSGVTDDDEGSGGYSDDLIFVRTSSSLSGVTSSDLESSDTSTKVGKSTSDGTDGESEGPSSLAESSLYPSTGTLADEAVVTGGSTDGVSAAASDSGVSGASTEKSGDLSAGSSSTEIIGSSTVGLSELPGASDGASTELPGTSTGLFGASSEPPGASTDLPIGSSDTSIAPASIESSPSGTDASALAVGTTPSSADTSTSDGGVSEGTVTDSKGSTDSSATDSSSSYDASATESSAASSVAGTDSTAVDAVTGSVSDAAGVTPEVTTTAGVSVSTSIPGETASSGVSGVSVSSAALVSDGSSSPDTTGSVTTSPSASSSDGADFGTTSASVTSVYGSESASSGGLSTTESSSSSGSSSSEILRSSIALTTEGAASESVSGSTLAPVSDSSTPEVSYSSTEAGGSTETASESSTSSSSLTETESTDMTSTESSFSPDTTDLTEAVFGFTTESDVDKAIKKEKKMKKCRRRKGPRPCVSSMFGCCPDGKTVAKGPFSKDVEKFIHFFSYGCCPDGKIAEGPYFEGCVETCSKTEFGCCPDGFTIKTGLDYEGCDIPSNETCSSSEFGCCPDGLSVASGPDEEGCQNCTESRFGCCPDGILAAKGIRQFGCAPACTTSDFGCCSDNKTFAHGPNQEGCCLSTPFGCCTDNVVPAQGPNYYGCDCRNSAYGCCPDGKTSASGPNNLGCGCQYSEFGCCPDRQTEADGPKFEGCSCHTYQFGCCPDGVRIVKGPNLEGCGCEHSAHGCCPDGKTAKEDPDHNCTCEATKFGCCPDGVAEAQGDNFEGCENVPITGEVCSLPRANGDGRDFKIVYWFDNTYGGCARFWYGGKGGNQNRFKTLDECKSVCVQPTGKDVCSLPVSSGSCRHSVPMWYFDKAYKQCRPFTWTGCLGNSNRFHTREECELQCGSQDHLDPCEQTLEHGPCNGTFERWYYNKEDRDCIPFTYGGCKGTKNNFLSLAACKAKCAKPDQQRPECSLPKAPGTCTDKLSKWYFELKEKRCRPFYYSGCGGNGNHFDSLEDCNGYCPVSKEKDLCVLPSDVGSCSTYMLRWYYDTLGERCKQFYWGGCAGNGNNFLTERDCLKRCNKPQDETPEAGFRPDMCSLPAERGRCSESISQWRYDPADGTCKVFDYSGCEGNGNRFETEELCLQSCSRSQDPCSLPKVQGPCDKYEIKWHFDRDSGSCRQFYYGGCHGNANRFQNAEECRETCQGDREPEREPEPRPEEPRPEPEQPQPEPEQPQPEPEQPDQDRRPPLPASDDICYLRYDPGLCNKTIEAWYYDPGNERCNRFVYGGCQGNANRFVSEEQCERQCGIFKNQEVCADDVEEGICNSVDEKAPMNKFYFDKYENVCRPFVYSGCGGNINRFSSLDECNTVCFNFTEPKIPQGTDQETTNRGICGLPMETGPCESITKRYFYDSQRRTCVSFVFSGCGGNLNNFLSVEDCTNTCVAPSPEPEQPDPNAIDVGAGPSKEDCPSKAECGALRCPYGIEKWVDNSECEQCRCHDPCAACGGPCDIRLVPGENGDVYRGFCDGRDPPRPVAPGAKPGQCPEVPSSDSDLDLDCTSNCDYDAECSGADKCCYNGCATVCSPVGRGDSTREEPSETPPYIDDDTEQRVEGEEGNLIGLHCIARGVPTPTVMWKRNGEMLSPISGSKYRISQNGTLEIILLRREDEGTYTCEASNGVHPSATRDYELIVRAGAPLPVAVVNNKEDTAVVVTLGSPAVMRCYAIGFPIPAINWFRGSTVLPISDDEFNQTRDNSLHIRAVSLTNLGFYTCQVYNGQGKPASHKLVLKAFGPITGTDPNDLTANEFLVPSSDVSSSDINFRPPPPYEPPAPPPRPVEPLRYGLNIGDQHIKAGSNLTLTCNLLNQDTNEPIDVMFTWQKNDMLLAPVEGRIIPQGNQLVIANADEEDSGNYTCLFDYNGREGITDPVVIVVQRTLLHPDCKDHQALANCSLIVNARYCNHKYYAKFCCKSCTEAGQLPVHQPGAPPPWLNVLHNRRPRSLERMLPSRLTPINAPDHETDFKVRFKSPIVEKFILH
ncbi:hypothetical protein GE061_005981, partial [Apolygus lucorum]